ncbi:hypothetical protein ILUMI_18024 [Ignelater luminosus]|uniref:Uncharacterized protein n=1 Tax=Ignelater luminosus TaxID=2038154 RepID=A0A8K0G7B4_IGNLU|nr:hypothetical protein ILUMI_18024 [Ignelater luminosus]
MEQRYRNNNSTSKFETLLLSRKRLNEIQLHEPLLKHAIKQKKLKKFEKAINPTKENEHIADKDCDSDKDIDNELCECKELKNVNIV